MGTEEITIENENRMNVFWRYVVGHIQHRLPAYYMLILIQGYFEFQKKSPLLRNFIFSLNPTNLPGTIFKHSLKNPSTYHLGRDYAISSNRTGVFNWPTYYSPYMAGYSGLDRDRTHCLECVTFWNEVCKKNKYFYMDAIATYQPRS